MAIPKFVSAGAPAGGVAGQTPGTPPNIQDDDILLLHIEGEGEDANADPGPPGWNLVDSVASGITGQNDKTRLTIYWIRYNSAAPPSFDVPDAGQHTYAIVTAWRGCITTESPIHKVQISSDGVNDTTMNALGVTTEVDGCAIVVSSTAGDDVGYNTWTNSTLSNPPILPNEVVDESFIAGSDGSIHVAWGGMPFAGATGNITATVTAVEEEANIVIALKPKPFVVGELGNAPHDVRGFRIWYDDGTNYKSTSNTLPALRTEWNAQTKTGIILIVIRYEDKYGIYNKGGIHVERFYREFMPPAAAGSTDWRVWYDPPTRTFGAGTAAQMPSQGEHKDYTDSALLAVDNSGNESDDVLQTWDAQLRAAYASEYSEAGQDLE